MRETAGNMWDLHDQGAWICITTNGQTNNKGHLIMGAGVAKVAKHRYKDLPSRLGGLVRKYGNYVWAFPEYKLFSFPTKHDWREDSDLSLIVSSAKQLMEKMTGEQDIYLPRPGCGLGNLNWESEVKPAIESILDDRVIVITHAR